MIARFLAFPLLELKTCWKRPLNLIMFAVFGLFWLANWFNRPRK